jgi:hypothetical protein
MKMAGTGATFPSMPGAQRILEMSLYITNKSFQHIVQNVKTCFHLIATDSAVIFWHDT